MSESFAMCPYNDCINKDNCIRYKDIASPYYCLINYKQICNDNNGYQWIVKKDKNISIKKLSDIPKVEEVNTDNTEIGENNINETNITQNIQQEESKDKASDSSE